MNRLLAVAAIVGALTFAACGDDGESGEAGIEPPATGDSAGAVDTGGDQVKPKPAKPKPGTKLEVADSQFGPIVFDSDQAAIYIFDKETQGKSECYGACAEAWPPVLTKGEPVGAKEIDDKGLGTTKRDDGSIQVTYQGQPLYYYAHDPPGQVLCHNVFEFGGLWLVIEPDGAAVQ